MLELEFPALFLPHERPSSPRLTRPGLALAADELRHEGGWLHLHLDVTCMLPAAELAAFTRLDRALTLVVEHPESGRAAVEPLQDPHKRYPKRSGPNYAGPPASVRATSLRTRYLHLPLLVRVDPAADVEPSLFVRVLLQARCSNRLCIDVGRAALVATTGGITP